MTDACVACLSARSPKELANVYAAGLQKLTCEKNSLLRLLALFGVVFTCAADAVAATAGGDGGWQWHPVEESACGDGSPTGFGLNVSPKATKQLAIFFQGGGACRDYFECYILHTAANLEGYDEDHFAYDVETLDRFPLNDREHPNNPFSGMHLAWFPYCTGDLHAGHRVADYGAYHLGGDNTAKYLETLAARFPKVKSVWLVGFSAGGFGAVLNWEVAQQAFLDATIHLVDDSGLAFGDCSAVPEQWDVINAPEDCEGCQGDMSRILTYIAARSPKSRVAWVSYETDTTLPFFLSLSRQEFSDNLQTFAEKIDGMQLPNLAYFYARGEGHVVSSHAEEDGFLGQYINWLGKMVKHQDAWESERSQASSTD